MRSCQPDPLAADIVHVGEDGGDGTRCTGRLRSPCGRVQAFDKHLVDAVVEQEGVGASFVDLGYTEANVTL
jgi:hypothetical protein